MIADRPVRTTKKMGMTHSWRNLAGVRKKATFENRRAGVKRATLM
jgi:hypothetical protein